MKLTASQENSLIASTALGTIIQKRLADKQRLTYHISPVIVDNPTQAQTDAYAVELVTWKASVVAIEKFNSTYFQRIADAKSVERFIFVKSLSDFDYLGISGLNGDYVLDIVSAAEYQTFNIINLLIDQMFAKITLAKG